MGGKAGAGAQAPIFGILRREHIVKSQMKHFLKSSWFFRCGSFFFFFFYSTFLLERFSTLGVHDLNLIQVNSISSVEGV